MKFSNNILLILGVIISIVILIITLLLGQTSPWEQSRVSIIPCFKGTCYVSKGGYKFTLAVELPMEPCEYFVVRRVKPANNNRIIELRINQYVSTNKSNYFCKRPRQYLTNQYNGKYYATTQNVRIYYLNESIDISWPALKPIDK